MYADLLHADSKEDCRNWEIALRKCQIKTPLFEIINNAALEKCIFFYYNDSECERIKLLLPQLNAEKRLVFQSAKKFWEGL